MNKIQKTVWNATLGAYVQVTEAASDQHTRCASLPRRVLRAIPRAYSGQMALEQRIVLDAAMLATAVDAVVHETPDETSAYVERYLSEEERDLPDADAEPADDEQRETGVDLSPTSTSGPRSTEPVDALADGSLGEDPDKLADMTEPDAAFDPAGGGRSDAKAADVEAADGDDTVPALTMLADASEIDGWEDATTTDPADPAQQTLPPSADTIETWWNSHNTDLLEAETEARWQAGLEAASTLLQELAARPEFDAMMLEVFGQAGTDAEQFAENLESMQRQLSDSGLNLDLDLRSNAELQSHPAAYAIHGHTGGERIYVNADWLNHGASIESIQRVVLEETGHAIDWRLNAELDSPGDEGALFAALLLEQSLDAEQRAQLLNRNDHGHVVINGEQWAVQFSSNAPVIEIPTGLSGLEDSAGISLYAA